MYAKLALHILSTFCTIKELSKAGKKNKKIISGKFAIWKKGCHFHRSRYSKLNWDVILIVPNFDPLNGVRRNKNVKCIARSALNLTFTNLTSSGAV